MPHFFFGDKFLFSKLYFYDCLLSGHSKYHFYCYFIIIIQIECTLGEEPNFYNFFIKFINSHLHDGWSHKTFLLTWWLILFQIPQDCIKGDSQLLYCSTLVRLLMWTWNSVLICFHTLKSDVNTLIRQSIITNASEWWCLLLLWTSDWIW
jgi:hypothetical protein